MSGLGAPSLAHRESSDSLSQLCHSKRAHSDLTHLEGTVHSDRRLVATLTKAGRSVQMSPAGQD